MKRQLFALITTMTAEELEALWLEMETHKEACAPEDKMDPPTTTVTKQQVLLSGKGMETVMRKVFRIIVSVFVV